ncbi:DUF4231 domain-containing protein [Actinoplanes friuliensis]|uniref:SMODS and SLOG-associating 2TM effector domain-containing protein n=1 Tax=Actinoplanes friuliensis DSM 7358 TaxID=1246995 RepID=U5VYI1_9ACTN|nr:DUF4231 domain-containing protein [Actinoplanes friuliensis]AGZ40706.1 hypothetical protein AFR_12100 [Actinoplanes friuliensis DSM 7358]
MTSSLEAAWAQQSLWSQAATKLKRRLQTTRRAALGLAIGGAVLSATAATVGLESALGKVFAFAGAVLVGLSGLAGNAAGPTTMRDWTRVRSISEALKSAVYMSLAGFPPADLDAEIQDLEAGADDLRQYKVGIEPKQRPLPSIHDLESYLEGRVEAQIIGYYRKNARNLARTLERFRRLSIGLAITGLLLGAAAGTWEIDRLAGWVPVVTTIGAAVAAYVAAERYSYMLLEYSRTADELARIRHRRGRAASMTDEELVRHAENVISIQNEGWMAKLNEADEPAP